MKIATFEIRVIVVKAYQARTASRRQLADIFGYHIETIGRWIRQSRQGQPTSLSRGHRRSVFSAPELEQLAAYIEINPDATLKEIREHFEKKCSLPALHKLPASWVMFKKKSEGKRIRAREYSQKPC
jgi:transposase